MANWWGKIAPMTEALGVALIAVGLLVLFVLGSRRTGRRASLLKLKPSPLPTEGVELNVLHELELRGLAARAKAERDEKNRRWRRPFGIFARLVTYAALFLALYAYWPKDISNTPLAGLTLNDIISTAGAIVFALFLIRSLFSPSEDDQAKEVWEAFGVIIMFLGLAVSALFLLRHFLA
jgi:hypothetical protein